MNPDTVAPRIRPFAFNPNSINPPRSVRPLNLGSGAHSATPQHQLHLAQRSTSGWQDRSDPPPASPRNKRVQTQYHGQNKRQLHTDTRAQKQPFQREQQPAYRPQLNLSLKHVAESPTSSANGAGNVQPQRNSSQLLDRHVIKQSHKDSDATADIPLPAAKKPKAYTSKFTVQSSSPIPESDDLSLDSKSVVIRDSSDDDFANELEFPDDILQVARSNSSARQYPCLQQHEQQLSPPAPPDEYVFNADLDPDTAIKAIKGIQSMLSDLAEEGIAIIRDMEAMIERYQHAVDQAIASEIQQKEALAAQWERAKKDSQMLLNSVKTYITQQLCR